MKGFYDGCLEALMAKDAASKTRLIAELRRHDSVTEPGEVPGIPVRVSSPGRPDRPELVHPRLLPQRKLSSPQGQASFIHAIAHIEFNAINLALDAVYRFRDMPEKYSTDWLSVAADEARHHQLLVDRLNVLGFAYGDFPAHNGLWDMALRTGHDVLVRMALIPCVFEARGLDVTPPMIARLENMGDGIAADILRLILHEEVNHVAIGNHWYRFECQRRKLDADETFIGLVGEYLPNRKHGPFNYPDRRAAGFSDTLIDRLGDMSAPTKPR